MIEVEYVLMFIIGFQLYMYRKADSTTFAVSNLITVILGMVSFEVYQVLYPFLSLLVIVDGVLLFLIRNLREHRGQRL